MLVLRRDKSHELALTPVHEHLTFSFTALKKNLAQRLRP